MRLRGEIEFRWSSPAPDFQVVVGAPSHGHAAVRQVGNAGENGLQALLEVSGGFFRRLNLLPQIFCFADQRAGILPGFLQLGDLVGGAVALSLEDFGFGDGLAAAGINIAEVFENFSRIHAPLAQLFFNQGQIFAYKIQLKHGE